MKTSAEDYVRAWEELVSLLDTQDEDPYRDDNTSAYYAEIRRFVRDMEGLFDFGSAAFNNSNHEEV
jgi:hypothetical protein